MQKFPVDATEKDAFLHFIALLKTEMLVELKMSNINARSVHRTATCNCFKSALLFVEERCNAIFKRLVARGLAEDVEGNQMRLIEAAANLSVIEQRVEQEQRRKSLGSQTPSK